MSPRLLNCVVTHTGFPGDANFSKINDTTSANDRSSRHSCSSTNKQAGQHHISNQYLLGSPPAGPVVTVRNGMICC